jgi:dihydrofolate reductase
MRKLISFMVVTLDGYTEGPNGEFDWPNIDGEFDDFAVSQLNDIGTLVFGRRTYEGMAEYWPTDDARAQQPAIAERMNGLPKIVFSQSLNDANWENTTLVRDDAAKAIAELKGEPGGMLASFGCATLTASLLEQGVVDEVRILVNPILLGGGVSLFSGLHDRVPLRLARTTVFGSGNVLLTYEPKTA